MEENRELLEELMLHVQRQYTQVVEIGKITSELREALSRDDRESVEILLELRQREMEQSDDIERGIRAIIDATDADMQVRLRELLDSKRPLRPEDNGFEAKKIKELACQIKRSLTQIIESDKALSRKLAGNDSYYKG